MINLSKISLAVVATTMLLGSTSALAAHHAYKGEGNYKGEAMAAPAAPCVQPLALHDGFYLGAQGGYDTYSVGVSGPVTVTNTGTGATATTTTGFAQGRDIAANGFVGGLFGGYGMYWNNFYYLAGELFVNDSGANDNITGQTTTIGTTTTIRGSTQKASVSWSWGVSILPGLKVNDSTLAYVRLGYSQARIQGTDNYLSTSTSATVLPANVNGTGNTRSQSAFQYGIGLETAVYQNISVRGEYSHANYGSFTQGVTGTKFSASDNQFMAGLIYHFA